MTEWHEEKGDGFLISLILMRREPPRLQRNFKGSSAPRTRCCTVNGEHKRGRFSGVEHNPIFVAIGYDPFPTPLRTSAPFGICLAPSPLHIVGFCCCAGSLLVEANFFLGWIVVTSGWPWLEKKRWIWLDLPSCCGNKLLFLVILL